MTKHMNEFLHAFILTDSCNIVQMYYLCSHGNSMKNGLRKHVVESCEGNGSAAEGFYLGVWKDQSLQRMFV